MMFSVPQRFQLRLSLKSLPFESREDSYEKSLNICYKASFHQRISSTFWPRLMTKRAVLTLINFSPIFVSMQIRMSKRH